jgi:DNA-directed RNA polymerase II subunit RPB11
VSTQKLCLLPGCQRTHHHHHHHHHHRFSPFVFPFRVTQTKDTKIPNAATFLVLKEDHTLGNILRMQLHRDPNVLFAAYRMPHPLEHNIALKIQTTDHSSPMGALNTAIKDLICELNILEDRMTDELERNKRASATQQMYFTQ